MVAEIAPLSLQILQGGHDSQHFLDCVNAGLNAESAGMDAHVTVSGVTLATVDLDPEVDQTALDWHDREIRRLGHEDRIDRRQVLKEMASTLPKHFFIGHDMDPEITREGNP